MQLVAIYGWDIDFALDIRKGDSFTVIYEEQYKEGRMVVEGPIIAAEFINKEKVIRAFRYLDNSGRNDYYNSNGEAMRKAFLRTPVDFFSRISSKFSFGRKHPVLNKIRAHKGVDYAAPMGTPIKATGDGIVAYVGKNGGFGNTIKLKHGGAYTTVYAHLHRFVKNISRGKKVKQGQIIGYVGQSGLATGPHLHYEFQIHGVHRNPLTVKLPKVKTIKKEVISEFKKSIRPMLAELDRITGKNVLSARYPKSITKEIKMNDG
ncbi:MAG: M24/M37 family peptidase [Legionellales bacterium]|nr:M24/M37 family peptidase [Legionellales bacterium]